MINEQLNTALKDICRTGNSLGMVAFQHLEEILNHTYEYTCREDICCL